jgi:hypothetical protein
MNRRYFQNIVFASTLIWLTGLTVASGADQEAQPQTSEVQDRRSIDVSPQTHVVAPAVQAPGALEPSALLARIVQLEATVVQMQKALSCMDAWFMNSEQQQVFPPPHTGQGFLDVKWNGYRCQ